MRFFRLVVLALLGQAQTTSIQAAKRQQPSATDVEILQLGLGVSCLMQNEVDVAYNCSQIKQLSVAFYQKALSQFSLSDFFKTGHLVAYYNNLLDITFDEVFHVALLTDALHDIGVKPNQPCDFTFPFHNVPEFIELASVLEGITTDAFVGISSLLQTPELNRNAEAILAVDAMHTAIQRAEAGLVILANPRKQPITPNQVSTLLAPFIISCASSNMPNGSHPFPPLQVDAHGIFKQLSLLPLSITNGELPSTFFATFISGDNVKTSFPTHIDGRTFKAPVGENMAGQTYVVVSNVNNNGTLDDSNIVFGPTVFEAEPLPRNISAFDSGL